MRLRGRRLLLGLTVLVALWALVAAPPAGAQAVPVIITDPPGTSVVGNGYIHQFQTSPQAPEPTFQVTNGSLPPGVILSPQGFLSGVATQAGNFGPTTVCASNGVNPSACQTFTITILKRSPTMLDAASPGGPVGTPVRDRATLVGFYQPTGEVTFRLFSDPGCTTEVFSSTNPVDANGVATSGDFTPTVPGTYRWTASYSGDSNNNPVQSPCGPNMVTITGGTTTTSSTTSTTSTTATTSTTSTSTSTSTSLGPSTTTTTMPTTSSTVNPSSTTSTSPTTSSSSTTTTTTPNPTSTTSSSTTSSTTSSSTTSSTTSTTAPTTSSTTSTTVPASTTTSAPATSTTSSPATTATVAPTSTATSTTVAATTTTAGAGVATSTTAPAPGGPRIQATPQQVTPGQSVTVAGAGFPPTTPVVAELFSDPVVLGSMATDANGAFTLVVAIPTETSPGLHTLRVRTADATVAAETTLAVIGPVATTALHAAAGTLSRTGSDATGPARMAAGLVAVGLVLLGLSWRERAATGSQWRGGRRRW